MPNRHTPTVAVGTSGYQYKHWKGLFYPEDIPQRLWFEHYATMFDTVEINNTFYHLPHEKTFQSWHDRAPDDFRYILKFSRYGSHIKRMLDPQETVTAFLERARLLAPLLGPILVQLPPHWHVDAPRLDAFLQTAHAVAAEQGLKGQRWAVEFRDPSWLCDAVYRILRRQKAALCIHDLIENHPPELTTDWVYLRFHGAGMPDGNYTTGVLQEWAQFAKDRLSDGCDVFAYFNNDIHGYAVTNALELRRLIMGDQDKEGALWRVPYGKATSRSG